MNKKIYKILTQALALEINDLESMTIEGHQHVFDDSSISFTDDFTNDKGFTVGSVTKVEYYLDVDEDNEELYEAWEPFKQRTEQDSDRVSNILAAMVGEISGNGIYDCEDRGPSVYSCSDISIQIKNDLVDSEKFMESIDEKIEFVEEFDPESEYETLLKEALLVTLTHIQENL